VLRFGAGDSTAYICAISCADRCSVDAAECDGVAGTVRDAISFSICRSYI